MAKLNQKTSFGLIAKEYQKYRRSYDPKLYKLLFSFLPSKKSNESLNILDIGCGTGKSTEPIVKLAGKRKVSVTGVDPDPRMLREARLSARKQKLSIVYVKGSAEKLPFQKEEFDGVISGTAFHWYGNKKTVSKIKSAVKEGGVFFVFWTQYVKSNKKAVGHNLYHKYNWRGIGKKFRGQESLGKLLSQSGFKKVKFAKILFSEKRTVSHIINNLKTNSSYLLMSPKNKNDFIRELTAAYKKTLGNKKYFTEKLELLVCYGFK
ncbi:MAG: methyltransferase domain-containing protein [Patescibacteria group bacterium]